MIANLPNPSRNAPAPATQLNQSAATFNASTAARIAVS
jgi:hypothetical protein